MATAIATLVRVFKMGATKLRDIDPSMSPEEVLKVHALNYPFLMHAEIDPPVVEGDELVFNVRKPAAQTKGAGKGGKRRKAAPQPSEGDALAAIEAWAGGGEIAVSSRVRGVFDVARGALNRQVPTDPFLIPMA